MQEALFCRDIGAEEGAVEETLFCRDIGAEEGTVEDALFWRDIAEEDGVEYELCPRSIGATGAMEDAPFFKESLISYSSSERISIDAERVSEEGSSWAGSVWAALATGGQTLLPSNCLVRLE